MNVVRKRTFTRYPDARITYGSETSPRRKELGLEKTHYNDAITISGIETIKQNVNDWFYYKQFRKKKRSLHESIPRKGLKKKNIESVRNNKNVKFRKGTYLNDKVKYNGICGWVYGFSSGKYSRDCVVRNIEGNIMKMTTRKNSLSIHMPETEFICHNNGWMYGRKYKTGG